MRLGFSLDEEPIEVRLPKNDDGTPKKDAAKFQIGFIPAAKFDELMVSVKLSGSLEGIKTIAQYTENRRCDDEVVRWGVRGHSDLFGKNGKPVPFETADETYEGQVFKVVATRLVDAYRRAGLVPSLALEIMRIQRPTEEEKKS